MPEEAQPIREAVGHHFGPVRLGPGQEVQCRLQQGARSVARTRGFTEWVEEGRMGIVFGQCLEE